MILRKAIYKTGLYNWSLRGRVPVRVRGVPPDPWSGDAEKGRGIIDGNHVMFGSARHLGDLPWRNAQLSKQERRLLHRFDGLGDLKALGTDDARRKGRGLMARWVNAYRRWDAIAWDPGVLGPRLTNWLRSYDFFRDDKHPGFDLTFLESTSVQMRHLARTLLDANDDIHAIEAAEGLILGSLCLVGMEAMLDAGLAALEQTVSRQVLADGGHFQRNPTLQCVALRSLIRVRDTLKAARVDTPPWLQHAIDRMAPMVKAFRLGDGKLTLCNGSQEGNEGEISAILKAAGSTARASLSAPHSGFQRMEAGKAVLVADAGAAVFSGSDQDAHAGLLGFEFSHRKNRIIVNCGAYGDRNDDWHDALRATAAHSTLTLDDTNAVEVRAGLGHGDPPPKVACRRNEADGSTFLQLQHEGYVRRFGMIHNRDIYLAASGEDLRGRDSLAIASDYMGPQAKAFCVRFHLHPAISAAITGDGESALLKLSNREAWRMRSSGGTLSVDDTVYMGVKGVLRRARQISLGGPCKPTGVEIKWSFIREG